MKKQYTKKQITEAIAHWQKVLESIDESKNTSFDEILKIAKQVAPEEASKALAASKQLNDSELNEGTGSGIAIGVLGTLLSLNVMCNIFNRVPSQLKSLDVETKSGIAEASMKFANELNDYMNEVQDNLRAIAVKNGIAELTVEELADAQAREDLFQKIMAEK